MCAEEEWCKQDLCGSEHVEKQKGTGKLQGIDSMLRGQGLGSDSDLMINKSKLSITH